MEEDEKQDDIFSPEVRELVQPGTAVRVDYGKSNVNNEVRHILAIVDEEYVVYRVWGRTKQRWLYQVEWMYGFQLFWQDGHLKKV